MTLFPTPTSISLHIYYNTSCMYPIRCFFQYKITVPDTREVEIDESFGFQPYFHKMWNNFNISLCMCTAVHTNRHEQFLSWTHHFWILQPHLQPWSRCHTNLQQHAQTYVTWDKVTAKHYNCSHCYTCNTQFSLIKINHRIKKSMSKGSTLCPTDPQQLYSKKNYT